MKIQITKRNDILHRPLIISLALITGLIGFFKCDAQSIIGKWQRDLTIVYTVDKASGKQVPLSPEQQKQYDEAASKNGYVEVLEFKSDNTYTSTVTAGGEKKMHSEKYSISGNELDMNIPLVSGQKTTIYIESLTATKMLWDLEFIKKKTGIGYKRI